MSRRVAVTALAVVLLLAAGTGLILLAADVRGAADGVEAGDAAYALDPARPTTWTAHGVLPGSLGERLLGVGAQLRFREAAGLYEAARGAAAGFDNGYTATQARGEAQAALAEIERFDPDPRRAAAAANLLGILAFTDARDTTSGATAPVSRAIAEFRNAVRLDGANEDAKHNLELVLRLLRAGKLTVTFAASAGGFGPVRRGSGESPAGSGY